MAGERELRTAWAVVEEHLEEAAFLWEMRQRCLNAPSYSLEDVRQGPEARLLAHLDALVVGGATVSERVLLPLLQDEEAPPAAVAAAALALLQAGEPAQLDACVGALVASGAGQREALVRALSLFGHPELPRRLFAAVNGNPRPAALAALLRVLAGYRAELGPRLAEWLQSSLPEVVLAALELVARSPSPKYLPYCEALLGSEHWAVRDAALQAALLCGSTLAWQRCVERAARALAEDALCLSLVGLLGRGHEQELLLRALRRGDHSEGVLWGCCFAGRRGHVDAAVEYLQHPNPGVAKCAGEVLTAVAGYQPAEGGIIEEEPADPPAFEAEDLDADLVPTAAELLPRLKPEAACAWWAKERRRFAVEGRYTGGRSQCLEALVAALRDGPTRRRAAWALGVAVASQARLQVVTDALYPRQRRHLERLSNANPDELWRLLT